MQILTAISPKGGVGKTTLLYSVAKTLHDQGKKVLVLDPDPNMSFFNMYERRVDYCEANGTEIDYPDVQTFTPSKTNIKRQLHQAGEGYDCVIVDTHGKIERMQTDLMYDSDLILVPIVPLKAAINSALDTCDALEAVREENEGLPIYSVARLNFRKQGVAEREYRKSFGDAYQFNTETRPYECYKEADQLGLAVVELDKVLPKRQAEAAAKASIDMRRLCKEITDLLEAINND